MNTEIIALKESRARGLAAKRPPGFFQTRRAGERFFGFVTAHIRNEHAGGLV